MSDPKIEGLLSIIKRELALLSTQLDTYQQLFLIERARRRALIEKTAPGFFAMVQMALVESMLMRTSRLMDPSGAAGKGNASFAQLFDARLDLDDDVCAAQSPNWKNTMKAWNCGEGEFNVVKHVRNKFMAHNDQTLWFSRDADEAWMPLSQLEFDALIELSQQLWEIFRRVHLKLAGSDVVEAGVNSEPPTRILRHLAGATFLDELLDRRDDLLDETSNLLSHIAMAIGDERPQPALGQGALSV